MLVFSAMLQVFSVNHQVLNLEDFNFSLPEDQVASAPVVPRDSSRLLVVPAENQPLRDRSFRNLPQEIPSQSLVVVNESRVVPARLWFKKHTGGQIEFFTLGPEFGDDFISLQKGFAAQGAVTWRCMVGGKKVVPGLELVFESPAIQVQAQVLSKEGTLAVIRFAWTPESLCWREVLERIGHMPLPPYLRRQDQRSDQSDYQTVYSKIEGSVAAPTAGLHFTPEVLAGLSQQRIGLASLVLHVGMGTFKPVETSNILEHAMHAELFEVSLVTIQKLIHFFESRSALAVSPAKLVVVGTTSLRVLESLFWLGLPLLEGGAPQAFWHLRQWEWRTVVERFVREQKPLPSVLTVLRALESYLLLKGQDRLQGATQLMVVPGYPFQLVEALVTNFHQPRSTLLVLVSAFLGERSWQNIYDHAIDKKYRFYSYGDSSLLFR